MHIGHFPGYIIALDHKKSLNKFNKIEIFSDHNEIKLEIKGRRLKNSQICGN